MNSDCKLTFLLIAFWLTKTLLPLNASAAPGDLDSSFGAGGISTAQFSGGDWGADVAIQGDGKLLMGGYSSDPDDIYRFSLLRFNQNGSLDTSFNGSGRVTTSVGSDWTLGDTLAVQPDGKILLSGGTTDSFLFDFAVVRYNPDGTLDTGWNSTGKVTVDFGANENSAFVALQPDGKVVVAGETGNPGSLNSFDFAVARLNSNGSLDTSFGGTGKVITNISGGEGAKAILVQSDGRIVVAGAGYGGGNLTLVRYTSGGTLDTSFSGTGKVTTFTGSPDSVAYCVRQQSDGKLVVAGSSGGYPNENFVVLRYNADGSLDPSFNGTGKVSTDFGGSDYARDLVVQNDGKIVVAGSSLIGNNRDFALARYTAGGALDSSFHTTGKVTVNLTPYDHGNGVALQSDGKIVVGGSSQNGFTLLRFMSESGPAAELTVEQPANTPLPYGGTAAVAFEPAAIGFSSVRTFTVRNSGTVALSGLTVSAGGGAFTAGLPVVTSLAPGAATTFDTTFAPVAAGEHSALLQITASAAGQSPFVVHLTGLGLTEPVQITTPPSGQTVDAGQTITLHVMAVGTGSLTWQWMKNGAGISGATSPDYLIPAAQPWHAGVYSVVVSSGSFSTTSANAVVKVSPFPFNVWQGLVAYYPLNAVQSGNDFGPTAQHVTNQGAAAAVDSWGRSDGARRFIAAESDGMATASGAFFHSQPSFTWTAWAKTSGTYSGASTRIISTEGPDGSGQAGFGLYANSNGKFGAGLNWGGGGQGFESAAAYPANVWRLLAVTWDGSRLRLFVDGVQAGNRLYTGVTLTSDSPLYFGKYRTNADGSTGGYFDGWLDEVRFYNRVLTTADLVQLRASDDGMDLDNDGLGDAWEARYGFSAAVNEGGGDADGDGMTNREEYLAGSSPLNAASSFHAPQLNEVPGLNVLNLTWSGSPARNYAVQVSPDLTAWSTLSVLSGLPGPVSFVVEAPVRPARHYYKVVVVP